MTDTKEMRRKWADLSKRLHLAASTVTDICVLCDELDALRAPVEMPERPDVEFLQEFYQRSTGTVGAKVILLCDSFIALEAENRRLRADRSRLEDGVREILMEASSKDVHKLLKRFMETQEPKL